MSLEDDVEEAANLIRENARIGIRCSEFYPARVFRLDISISALGPRGEDRCSLIFEVESNDCLFLMLYDNDEQRYQEAISEVAVRRES